MFVVFEGLDGTGKSTQISRLADWLTARGVRVVQCRDPGSTELGNQIRELLLQKSTMSIEPQTEALLFFAARSQLVREIIAPALEQGNWVLCDRFQTSTLVYQGHAGQLDRDTLASLGRFATDDRTPDLTIVLDLPAETAGERIGASPDRLESRGLAYMRAVREGFLDEARRAPDRMAVVNASQSIETVAREIQTLIEGRWSPLLTRPSGVER